MEIKMKKLALALVTTIATTSISFATVDALPKSEAKTINETEVKALKKEIIDSSSRGFRSKKNFMAVASPLGFEFGTISSSLELGKFISDDGILTLKYSDLQADPSYWSFYNEEEEKIADENDKGYAITFGIKQFVSNSFYIKPQVYYRNQKKIYDVYSDYNADTDSYEITNVDGGTVNDLGFSFRIGNQWQWRHFTMGCDWFGFANSLSKFENDDISSSERLNLSLLNVYFGASF